MSTTVDTNVLLYASNAAAAEHERARALIEHLAEGPALVVLLWPTLLDYLRLATHPAVYANPLSHADAAANVDALLALPHTRPAGETERFWSSYREVAADVAPRGNLVSDAHLAALMHLHGVAHIWSRDRDLRKFDGIRISDPFADRYADRF